MVTETGTLKNKTDFGFIYKYHDMRKVDGTAKINAMSMTQTDLKTKADEQMVTEKGTLKNTTDCDFLHTYHDMLKDARTGKINVMSL